MRYYIRFLLSLLSAVLCFIAFVGFDQWYLAFISWVPLLVAVEGLPIRHVFILTLFMGTVAHFGGYYWLPGTLKNFGNFNWFLAYFFSIVLNIYQGLSFAIITTIRAFFRQKGKNSLFLSAIAFSAVEEFFPNLFPIFWGNTLYKIPVLVQSVDLLGVTFITTLIILINLAIAEFIISIVYRKKNISFRWELIAICALWIFNITYGIFRIRQVEKITESSEKIKIGVVQGNLGLMEKRQSPEESIRIHQNMSIDLEKKGAELIVWSESAVNYHIPAGIKNLKKPILQKIETPVIFGAIRMEKDGNRIKEYNTAYLLDEKGNILGYYDKVYLLAFGEYIPFGDKFPKLYEWSPNSGAFSKGKSVHPVSFKNHKIGIMICYEDILPDFVRKLMNSSEGKSDILINITNDGWFGKTNEPWIHLGLSIMRSIELRRWLIRSTNSGISAAIDPTGRIVKNTQVMEKESFVVEAGFITIDTIYRKAGWLYGYFCLTIVLILFIFSFKKTYKEHEKNGFKKRKKKSKS